MQVIRKAGARGALAGLERLTVFQLVIWVLISFLAGGRAQAQASWPAPPPLGELRGVWVDAYGLGFKTPAEIDALVADALALNLNALFVQVVRRGDCYCNLSTLPRSDDPELAAEFDPLETLLQKAHGAGLQVHAWVVATALWGADVPPTSPAHAYNQHGPSASGAESWLSVRFDGVTRPERDVYLDPGHPAVHDYLAEALSSLAQRYDLDGVSLDRLRYPDFNVGGAPSWGYNETSLARFAAETGGPIDPAPTDPAWTAWRREQLSALMRRLYLEVKQVDPSLWVSAATIVYGAPPPTPGDFASSHAYSVVLQDWAGWLQGGYLDLNLPMNYKQADRPDAAAWFNGWNELAPLLAGDASTAVATGIYLNEVAGTKAQLGATQAAEGVVGWVGYSYRTPERGVEAGWRAPEEAFVALVSELTAPGAPFAEAVPFGSPPASTFSALFGRLPQGQDGTVELLLAGEVLERLEGDANGFYGFVVEPERDYTLRLPGGAEVAAPVTTGRVSATSLTASLTVPSAAPLETPLAKVPLETAPETTAVDMTATDTTEQEKTELTGEVSWEALEPEPPPDPLEASPAWYALGEEAFDLDAD